MRLEDYLAIIRRNAVVLIALVVAGCIVGLAITLLQTPRYRSTVSVFVSTQQASNLNDLTQGAIFTQQAVKNYADVVTTPLVLQPALDSLGMSRSARALALEVAADNPLDTTVLNISVTDPSPVDAARLANAIEKSLAKEVSTLTPPTADSIDPVQIILLESAVASTSPVSPNAALDLGIGALVGLGAAVLVVLVRDALDRRSTQLAPAGRPVRQRTRRTAPRVRPGATPPIETGPSGTVG